jgi:hypothetical protein
VLGGELLEATTVILSDVADRPQLFRMKAVEA